MLSSCNLTNRFSQYMSDKINKRQLKKPQDIIQELRSYLIHAQKCKTEYEIESYADSLPLFRTTKIQIFGSEENWKGQLAWLKQNGAKDVSFVTPTGGGRVGNLPIPFFHRTVISPWGH